MKNVTRVSFALLATIFLAQGCHEDGAPKCDLADFQSRCDDTKAITCVDGKESAQNCADENKVCKDGACIPASTACDANSFNIRCENQTAILCRDGIEQSEICESTELCEIGKGCVQNTTTPCDSANFTPRCNGQDIIVCKEEIEVVEHCPNTNEVCHQNVCTDKTTLCDDNFSAKCEGDAIVSCEDGVIKTQACSDDGSKVCGLNTDNAYACIEATICNDADFTKSCDTQNNAITCVNGYQKRSPCGKDALCEEGLCITRVSCQKSEFKPSCQNGKAVQCVDGYITTLACTDARVCKDGQCVMDAQPCTVAGYEPTKCAGDQVVQCVDGYERGVACANAGEVCTTNIEGAVECVAAPVCVEADFTARCEGSVAVNCTNGLEAKMVCDKQSICVDGACRQCLDSEIVCDNVCVDPSALHLTACNVCAPNFADCDKDSTNGCETDLSSTHNHCKTCNNACSADAQCSGAKCVANCTAPEVACDGVCLVLADSQMSACQQCNPGYRNCDNNWKNGCEADLAANNLQSCDLCKDQFLDCDNNKANGCETQYPALHMLDCSRCENGYANCDNNMANGCEVKLSDRNWSSCNTCLPNTANCDNNPANGCEINLVQKNWASCGTCSAGFGNCTKAASGACTTRLTSNASAQGTAACVCTTGKADCDNNWENGCETDLEAMNWLNCSKACANGWLDWDKDQSNGCELKQGSNTCASGATRVCWPYGFEPQGTSCKKGVQTCTGNEWSSCVGYVAPVTNPATLAASAQDLNCNGIIDRNEDLDNDGFTKGNGDCCDDVNSCLTKDPQFVGPGAYEIAGDGIDNNCNNVTDEVQVLDCTHSYGAAYPRGTDTASAKHLTRAMDICDDVVTEASKLPGLISYRLQSSPPTEIFRAINAIAANAVPYMEAVSGGHRINPKKGASFALLSSGNARDAKSGGTSSIGTVGLSVVPAEYLAAHGGQIQSSPVCDTSQYINDLASLQIRMRVPSNAKGMRFKFRFFSIEYPPWVCSSYNDFFLAQVNSTHPDLPADHNISFDKLHNPVSVNNAFFTSCTPISCSGTCSNSGALANLMACIGGICKPYINPLNTALGTYEPCEDGAAGVQDVSTFSLNGGGTAWLQTSMPLVPGEVIDLTFYIWDTGDSNLDSTVIIDDFEWTFEATSLGTVIIPS